MTELNSRPEARSTDSGQTPRHKTPLWVKGFLVAAAVLVVVLAVMHLSGGMAVNHTP